MLSRNFMVALQGRSRRPSPRFNLPTRSLLGMNRAGALALIAPREVLDDPARVADRLAVDHQHRRDPLAGQLVELVAIRPPPRDALLDRLDPAPGQLPRDPAAGAQPVRRGLAPVQHDV